MYLLEESTSLKMLGTNSIENSHSMKMTFIILSDTLTAIIDSKNTNNRAKTNEIYGVTLFILSYFIILEIAHG